MNGEKDTITEYGNTATCTYYHTYIMRLYNSIGLGDGANSRPMQGTIVLAHCQANGWRASSQFLKLAWNLLVNSKKSPTIVFPNWCLMKFSMKFAWNHISFVHSSGGAGTITANLHLGSPGQQITVQLDSGSQKCRGGSGRFGWEIWKKLKEMGAFYGLQHPTLHNHDWNWDIRNL
jgi:hypothetical protein